MLKSITIKALKKTANEKMMQLHWHHTKGMSSNLISSDPLVIEFKPRNKKLSKVTKKKDVDLFFGLILRPNREGVDYVIEVEEE